MWWLPSPPTPWIDGTWRAADELEQRCEGQQVARLSLVIAGDGALADDARRSATGSAVADVLLLATVEHAADVLDAVVEHRPDFALLCDPPASDLATLLTLRLTAVPNAPSTRMLALARSRSGLVATAARRLAAVEQDVVLGLCQALAGETASLRSA